MPFIYLIHGSILLTAVTLAIFFNAFVVTSNSFLSSDTMFIFIDLIAAYSKIPRSSNRYWFGKERSKECEGRAGMFSLFTNIGFYPFSDSFIDLKL